MMLRPSTSLPYFLLWLVAGVAFGCSGPRAPKPPRIDPVAAGRAAVAAYDANGDGCIDATEAKKSPALVVASSRIDANADGRLSAEEIAARIAAWRSSGTTITSVSAHVTLDGKDLDGARVTFEPEEFLGASFTPCTGETDSAGNVLGIRGPDARYPGAYLGLYRVKISKEVDGRESIPARYNADTELGYEVATDLPPEQMLLECRLQSR